jgi:hypothetical protein
VSALVESPVRTTIAAWFTVGAGVTVALGQLLVITSFAAGYFLVSVAPTNAEISNGQDGDDFGWQMASWLEASSLYALVVVLVGVVVALFWFSSARGKPVMGWLAFTALALVIPAQLTVLGSVFN